MLPSTYSFLLATTIIASITLSTRAGPVNSTLHSRTLHAKGVCPDLPSIQLPHSNIKVNNIQLQHTGQLVTYLSTLDNPRRCEYLTYPSYIDRNGNAIWAVWVTGSEGSLSETDYELAKDGQTVIKTWDLEYAALKKLNQVLYECVVGGREWFFIITARGKLIRETSAWQRVFGSGGLHIKPRAGVNRQHEEEKCRTFVLKTHTVVLDYLLHKVRKWGVLHTNPDLTKNVFWNDEADHVGLNHWEQSTFPDMRKEGLDWKRTGSEVVQRLWRSINALMPVEDVIDQDGKLVQGLCFSEDRGDRDAWAQFPHINYERWGLEVGDIEMMKSVAQSSQSESAVLSAGK
ncbi:hypothetical protein FRB95_007669 [Tulasnella sp. JGI-2019a]|nr:hypothetical protein FRB95_007669 [Tulasnella sp. JGI-2019a]